MQDGLFGAKLATVLGVTAALAACSPPAQKAGEPPAKTATAAGPSTPKPTDAPAGEYKADPSHTSLIFRVNHLGLSNYTARFTKVDATMQFAPKTPSAITLTAEVDPKSLETDFPLPTPDFDAQLTGKSWLDAAQFPTISYRTTKVEVTGPDTATVTGDLTLHGVTRPLILAAKFNGGYPAGGMDPENARIGFSASGVLKRSEFGISYGIPAPGSNLRASDAVEIIIAAEFIQPGAARPATAAPAPAPTQPTAPAGQPARPTKPGAVN